MLISEMSREQCLDMLSRQGFGRLACAHHNRPYIVPIYFAYEPDHLYGFTNLRTKGGVDAFESTRVCGG